MDDKEEIKILEIRLQRKSAEYDRVMDILQDTIGNIPPPRNHAGSQYTLGQIDLAKEIKRRLYDK